MALGTGLAFLPASKKCGLGTEEVSFEADGLVAGLSEYVVSKDSSSYLRTNGDTLFFREIVVVGSDF